MRSSHKPQRMCLKGGTNISHSLLYISSRSSTYAPRATNGQFFSRKSYSRNIWTGFELCDWILRFWIGTFSTILLSSQYKYYQSFFFERLPNVHITLSTCVLYAQKVISRKGKYNMLYSLVMIKSYHWW